MSLFFLNVLRLARYCALHSFCPQFTASSDHSWEQTVAVQAGVTEPAAKPDEPAGMSDEPAGKADRVRRSGKRSRWE